MGQEIEGSRFKKQDFQRFLARLKQETELLGQWFADKRFANDKTVTGFELEAWLVDNQQRPAPINAEFIKAMNTELVCPELASFNVEFNYTPRELQGNALSELQTEMAGLWQRGNTTATSLDGQLVMIGILPTVDEQYLNMQYISSMNRYRALNEQVLRMRKGRALEFNISGPEHMRAKHMDVMFESATTSFQIHLQVPLDLAVRAYNASIILSAPSVAVSANSPFMCGKDLWAETRIPLFEQSVEVGGYEQGSHGPLRRVTFGSGYLQNSILECFKENLNHYPILLPGVIDDPPENFSNVRLHNGTLWRWNRPLIGVENGEPHIRIEHRVVPSGPSVLDNVANAAFYFGLAENLIRREVHPEVQLPFNQARDNFYNAAKYGFDAHVVWLDGKKSNIRILILDKLLPMAAKGLEDAGVDAADIDKYLGIIEQRARNSCNGAAWQRAFVAKYGKDMANLTRAYIERQNSGEPVHTWDL
ncbi:MAG: glutamate--cysteine ligase [Gammaproteobacteria bacterium]|jgi:gamma-glutamyl:cysteine ligase YbdK (ATP-grasp superfamily)